MKTALWHIQKSLYSCLEQDPDLNNIITGVFDDIPENTPLPYITLGEDTANDFSSKTFHGEDITHTLHIWSNYKGKKEVKQILELALRAVTKNPLTIAPGFQIDSVIRDMLEVFEQENGVYHGILRLRFKIIQE